MVVISTLALPADVDMRADAIGEIDIEEGFPLAL